MTIRIEESILSNLLTNEEFARKCIPFLDSKYFQDNTEKIILNEAIEFFTKYNQPITKDILSVQLNSRTDLTDSSLVAAINIVSNLPDDKTNLEWLVSNTEKFCKDKAVYNAILQSIKIIEGEDPKLTPDAIPSLLSDALSVTFDTKVGHDFLSDATARWEFYNKQEAKIPFNLALLDKITEGGMAKKAIYCVGAQSGGGKSILMTHTAASTLKQGKNVLYITLEMSEERIAERIDANLMKVDINKLKEMSKDEFLTRIDKVQSKTHGRLFVKEYPTGSAHVGHFRALLEELKVKQNFVADLIVVDYLGICASSRMKMGGSTNTYSYIKAVAEELRGLATEYDVPILTGAQLNRGGYDTSDANLSDTADSMGIVMTLDVFFALIRTEELDDQNSVMVKQLKNRYGDASVDNKFLLGLNRSKMTFYDLENSAQSQLIPVAKNKNIPVRNAPDKPLFDRSNNSKTLDSSTFKF